jgi:hypothetical protein
VQASDPSTAQPKYIIDNILRYDDPRLKEIRKNKYGSISANDDAKQSFSNGYKAGFNSNTGVTDFPNRTFKTSYLTDPGSFGFLVGLRVQNVVKRKAAHLVNLPSPHDLTSLFMLRNLFTAGQIEEIEVAANLHNNIISGVNEETLPLLERFFDFYKAKPNLMTLLNYANRIAWAVYRQGHDDWSKFDTLIEGMDVSGEASIRIDYYLKNAQIRMVDSSASSVQIRLQIADFKVETLATIEGKGQKVLNSYPTQGFENDLVIGAADIKNSDGPNTIKALKKKFKDTEHPNKSAANTDQVYFSVKIEGDYFVHAVTGEPIFPKSALTAFCKANHWISFDSGSVLF